MKMTLRLCTKCGESKSEDLFYKRSNKSGQLMTQCKSCTTDSSLRRYAESCEEKKASMRAYYSNNKNQIQHTRKARRETELEVKIKHMLRNAEQRSKLKGFDFNLDYEFINSIFEKQQGKCFYTGVDLALTGDNRLSIDRQDPGKGYTKDNVNLVCLKVNYMKRDISHEDFIQFCKIIGGKF